MITMPIENAEPGLVAIAKDWVSYYLKKWYIIFAVGLICGSIGVIVAWMQKPKYEARATFALQENSGGLSGMLGLAAEFGLNIGNSKDIFAGDNILSIISSRRIIESVLLEPDSSDGKVQTMAQRYMKLEKIAQGFAKHPRLKGVNFPLGQSRQEFSYLQDSILFTLQKRISQSLAAFRPDKKLNIFEVRFTSSNERFSKEFVERLIDQTVSFYTDLRSGRSRQTLDVLQRRVDSIKGALNYTINSRAAIQDANVNPVFAAAQAPLQRKQVDLSAYGAAYTELFKNLELARYQFLQDVPLLQVIDAPQYPMRMIKLGRLYTGLVAAILGGMICLVVLGFLKPRPTNTKNYQESQQQDTA